MKAGAFITISMDRDQTRAMWFDNRHFFCTYKIHEGRIILAEASPIYFKVINRSRNMCGHMLEEIFDSFNAEYLKKLFFYLIRGNAFRYVRKCSSDNTLWLITALAENGCINCIGQQLDFSEYAAEDFFIENNTDSRTFSVSAAAVYRQGKGFTILSVGSSMYSSVTDRIRTGMKLERIMKIFRFNITGEGIFSECMLRNKAISYSDLMQWGSFGKAVNIRLTPIADKNTPIVVIAIDEIVFAESGNNENRIEKEFGSCCISSNEEGIIITERLNRKLTELISSCEISLEQLCGSEFFSDRKSRTITGKSGRSYEVCVISEHCDADRRYRSLLIIPIYCNSSCDLVTQRELQLLKLAAGGNPNRYIAKVLNISEGTVKKILHNGYSKLGIGSRVELVKYFADRNIQI